MLSMKYSYYPGCTLRNKAKDLDEYARASARALGFELEEIEDWQCCGGVYPLGTDEIATKLSSVRALRFRQARPALIQTADRPSSKRKRGGFFAHGFVPGTVSIFCRVGALLRPTKHVCPRQTEPMKRASLV